MIFKLLILLVVLGFISGILYFMMSYLEKNQISLKDLGLGQPAPVPAPVVLGGTPLSTPSLSSGSEEESTTTPAGWSIPVDGGDEESEYTPITRAPDPDTIRPPSGLARAETGCRAELKTAVTTQKGHELIESKCNPNGFSRDVLEAYLVLKDDPSQASTIQGAVILQMIEDPKTNASLENTMNCYRKFPYRIDYQTYQLDTNSRTISDDLVDPDKSSVTTTGHDGNTFTLNQGSHYSIQKFPGSADLNYCGPIDTGYTDYGPWRNPDIQDPLPGKFVNEWPDEWKCAKEKHSSRYNLVEHVYQTDDEPKATRIVANALGGSSTPQYNSWELTPNDWEVLAALRSGEIKGSWPDGSPKTCIDNEMFRSIEKYIGKFCSDGKGDPGVEWRIQAAGVYDCRAKRFKGVDPSREVNFFY